MWSKYSRNVEYVYVLCMNPWMFVFDYTLIMKCELTPSGCLVDRLPYSYEWVDGVQE